MNPRERVARILNHAEADRVPIDCVGILCAIYKRSYARIVDYLGLDIGAEDAVINDFWSVVPKPAEAVLERFGVDFRKVWLGEPENFKPIINDEEGTLTDEWGLTWKKVGLYNEMVQPPLPNPTIEQIRSYRFPDPADPGRYRGLEDWARRLYEETPFSVVAGHSNYGVLELGCWLRGYDTFLANMLLDKPLVRTFFDRVLEYQVATFSRYLDIVGPYVQIVETTDDLAGQLAPLISPKMYRELIKPYHNEYVQFIKSKVPHAKVFMHTDGSVFDLIPDLIDVGIDILNPIQPKPAKMEPWRLKREFGKDLVFHGGIDVQGTLQSLDPEGVKDYVKKTVQHLAPGGGYILASSHNIQPDIPAANAVALYEAALPTGCILSQRGDPSSIESYSKMMGPRYGDRGN
jgi:uroporphyrinogen decarboxylase